MQLKESIEPVSFGERVFQYEKKFEEMFVKHQEKKLQAFRGLTNESENFVAKQCEKERKVFENEYIHMVLSADEKDYDCWVDIATENILNGMKAEEGDVEKEMLMMHLELYKKAKNNREELNDNFILENIL